MTGPMAAPTDEEGRPTLPPPGWRGYTAVGMDKLLLLCREIARRAHARPFSPLDEADAELLETLRSPVVLGAMVRARRHRSAEMALATVMAVGNAHGLRAATMRDIVVALLTGAAPRPEVVRAMRRLDEAGVMGAIRRLVEQAHDSFTVPGNVPGQNLQLARKSRKGTAKGAVRGRASPPRSSTSPSRRAR